LIHLRRPILAALLLIAGLGYADAQAQRPAPTRDFSNDFGNRPVMPTRSGTSETTNVLSQNALLSEMRSCVEQGKAAGCLTSQQLWDLVNTSVPGVNNTLSAAGTTQAGATAIPAATQLAKVTGGTGGVALPVAVAGQLEAACNYSGASISVYPANGSGASINGGSANAAIPLANGVCDVLYAMSATDWEMVGSSSPLIAAGTVGDTVRVGPTAWQIQDAGLQTPAVNITTYGAIGDGASHPACTVLGLSTLAQLQAYKSGLFSFATSCNDQIAWLSAQAIANANANIYVPSGTFNMDSNAATSGLLTLTSSSITGASSASSNLSWPYDLGSGNEAVLCGTTVGNGRFCSGNISHVSLDGPAAGGYYATHLGSAVAGMDGFFWGAREQVADVAISGFNKCLDIVGDQTLIENVTTTNCTYGLYFDKPSATNFGSMIFIKDIWQESSIAAVGVDSTDGATIGNDSFLQNCLCVAPFGILANVGSSNSTRVVTSESIFINDQFENLGNAAYATDNTSNDYIAVDYNSRWIGIEFIWNTTYRASAYNHDGIFDLYEMNLSTLDDPQQPAQWTAGAVAVFNIQVLANGNVTGDINSLGTPLYYTGTGAGIANFSFDETGYYGGSVYASQLTGCCITQSESLNGYAAMQMTNSNAGASAAAAYNLGNATGQYEAGLYVTGSGYSPANVGVVYGIGGLEFAVGSSTGNVLDYGVTTASTWSFLNGKVNINGITQGGTASKYVCIDSSGNLVTQTAAC
jgi:hypothetical protein